MEGEAVQSGDQKQAKDGGQSQQQTPGETQDATAVPVLNMDGVKEAKLEETKSGGNVESGQSQPAAQSKSDGTKVKDGQRTDEQPHQESEPPKSPGTDVVQKSSDRLTDKDWKEITETFERFSKDGSLSIKGLTKSLQSLNFNPTKKEAKDLMESHSMKDEMSFQEFSNAMAEKFPQRKKGQEEKELREAFQMFDADGNGHLDTEELRHLLVTAGEQMSEEEVNDFFSLFDKDADGKITCDEYIAAWCSL